MMLIASLVEFSISKTPMWQTHNTQLANFDVTSLRVIWFRSARFLDHVASRMPHYPDTGSYYGSISS
jgi:hypothetical protein